MGSYEHVWARIGVMDKNKSGIHGQLRGRFMKTVLSLYKRRIMEDRGKEKLGFRQAIFG